jgi:hypothetical protein
MNELSEATLAPLKGAEAKRAVAAALAYLEPELSYDGQSRYRVLGAELSLTRPRGKDTPVRREVEVLVVDYLGRRQVKLLVERERVVEVRDLEGQAAFAPEEISEATAIAAQVPQLKAIAGCRGVFSSAFAPGRCDVGTRRIGLRFVLERQDEPALLLVSAEADLVEQRLIAHEISPAGKLVVRTGGSNGCVR